MEKIHVPEKIVDGWADKLEIAYSALISMLCDDRKYKASDLMEIDKYDLEEKVDSMIRILKKINGLKDFKP